MRVKQTWDVVFARLRELGCYEDRTNGNHSVWKTPQGRSFPVWTGDLTRFPSRDYVTRISKALGDEGLALGYEAADEETTMTTTTAIVRRDEENKPDDRVFRPKPVVTARPQAIAA